MRITRATDTPANLQYFVTRIVGTEDLPDVEILTLPAYKSAASILSLNDLQRRISSQDYGLTVNIEPHKIEGSERWIKLIHQAIVDAQAQENIPHAAAVSSAYAEEIFSTQPLPILNSPLTGSTLAKLAGAAGGSAAFMTAVFSKTGVNVDFQHVALFFFLIGGTRIVLGAADGISSALKTGLERLLLDWMGVPATVASARKRKSPSGTRQRTLETRETEASLDLRPTGRKSPK